MHADVPLENQGVGELLVAHWTLMQHVHWWFDTVYWNVGLQVTLSGEGPATDLTLEWPLPSMDPVV